MKKKTVFSYIAGLAVGVSALTGSSFAADDAVEINETNFPDAAFRAYVETLDTDKNGSLDGDEIAKVVTMDVKESGITSLEGVEYFTELTLLNCTNNDITGLDISKNVKLTFLNCGFNKLTALDVSDNVNLETLLCTRNLITQLDVSKNVNLTNLSCAFNELKTIDVSNNTKLTSLDCGYNHLTSLDLSNNPSITSPYPSTGNEYDLGECNEFDLKELEQYGFDLTRVVDGNFTGAELKDGKLINFKDIADENQIIYAYDFGNGTSANFTLVYTPKAEESTSTDDIGEPETSTDGSDAEETDPTQTDLTETEDTQSSDSKGEDGNNNTDKSENPSTGLVIAFVPAAAAAAAVVIARKRK